MIERKIKSDKTKQGYNDTSVVRKRWRGVSDDVEKNNGLERRNSKDGVCGVTATLPRPYLWWNRLDPLQSVLIAVATERQLTDGCLQASCNGPSASSTDWKSMCTHTHTHTRMRTHILVAREKGGGDDGGRGCFLILEGSGILTVAVQLGPHPPLRIRGNKWEGGGSE